MSGAEPATSDQLRSTLAEVLGGFGITEPATEIERMGGGHIHRTWSVQTGIEWFVCQAVNERVFRDPDACEENLRRIDDHFRGQDEVRVPTLRRTAEGRVQHRAIDGTLWRVADFAVGTLPGTTARSATEAERSAIAFGTYARVLQSLPGGPLRETLPGFHDLPARVRRFEAVVADDPRHRGCESAACVAVARRLHGLVLPGAAEIAALPRVAVHNDAKVANVRFDAVSGIVRYVVDLDTTMPGSVLFDIGELLRTAAIDADEDTADLDSIRVHMDRTEAVVVGFSQGAQRALDADGRRLLPIAGPLMTLENATRFLTDHLEGDPYYAIAYQGQNLARARAQLRVVEVLLDAHDVIAAAAAAASG